MRLRTLPLSIAGIVTGSALAFRDGAFGLNIFFPAITTTLLLQILSNLANDYGDGEKGTDGEDRIGPERMTQSGQIEPKEIFSGILFTACLALFSGIYLLYESFGPEKFNYALSFFFVGVLGIWAAIKYTVGRNAYGYYGYGDIFVMLFFGFVSVIGCFILFTQDISLPALRSPLLQAITIGAFSTGVLHLNNMRDRESDFTSDKITMAVKLGEKKSKVYFILLMILAAATSIADVSLTAHHLTEFIQLLIFLPIGILVIKVSKITVLEEYNDFLKPLALSTFLYSILLFISFV